MRVPHRRPPWATIWLVLIALAVGYGSAAAAGIPLTRLSFALPVPVPDEGQVWAYVPQGAGYFAAEGLQVEFIPNAGGGAALRQVATGNATFSIGSPENMLNSVAAGMTLRAVATVVTRQIFRIVVLPDSPIRRIAEARGKKVGVSSFTSGSFPFAKFALSEQGIDPDRDVQFVTVGTGGPALDALKTGKVDVLSTWDTQIAIFEELGTRVRLLPDPSNVTFPADQILVEASTLARNPGLVARFARAVIKGIVFAHTNPDAAIGFYIQAFPDAARALSREAHVRILKARLANMQLIPSQGGRWGYIPLDDYARLQDAALQLGTVTRRHDLAQLMSNALWRQINDFDVRKVQAEAKAAR